MNELQLRRRFEIALGLSNGTYPGIDWFGAGILAQEQKIAERIKRWKE